jgi:hypothetical protein
MEALEGRSEVNQISATAEARVVKAEARNVDCALLREGDSMSGVNGDKSRHHRLRKQKARLRARSRSLLTAKPAEEKAPAKAKK